MTSFCRSLLIAMTCLAAVAAVAAPVMLQVTQKEGDMEKAIAKFMKDAHDLDFDIVPDEDGKGGMTLAMEVDAENAPDFGACIWCVPHALDAQGTLTERMVVIELFPKMSVPKAKRADVLEVMNKLNDEQNFTHLYIDYDNEVGCRWRTLVAAEGVAAESIFNAFAGMVSEWEDAQPQIAKALQ
ncbi:MAG: YbjN domain-containing protein [Armatimonadia bacterium]